MRLSITILVISILLTGCTTLETTLTNSAGQKARCSANGYGLIGSTLATSSFEDCVKKYEAQGYTK